MAASAVIIGGAQAVGSIGNAYSQSQAIQAQGEYQKSMTFVNQKFADLQGKEVLREGEKVADQVKTDSKRAIGSQRAILAANGVDVDVGSAVDIQADTSQQAEIAAMTIKNNAWRQAWGIKQEATAAAYNGKFSSMATETAARNTLITGGYQAAGYATQAIGSYNSGSKK